MGCRPRINRVAVCSSYNYPKSRIIHLEFIREKHENNKQLIIEMQETVIIKKKYYVMCFGEKIEISEEEARSINSTIRVYSE